LIDTIAMIGSPASRGAVASVGGAGRACLGAASAVSAVNAAIAASVIMAGARLPRIATVDRAVVNRFIMPCSG
jgi:5,10-methenyltetrahydromethanopterin hydrogenase